MGVSCWSYFLAWEFLSLFRFSPKVANPLLETESLNPADLEKEKLQIVTVEQEYAQEIAKTQNKT